MVVNPIYCNESTMNMILSVHPFWGINKVSLFESFRLLGGINVASPVADEHSLIKLYVNQLHNNSRSV